MSAVLSRAGVTGRTCWRLASGSGVAVGAGAPTSVDVARAFFSAESSPSWSVWSGNVAGTALASSSSDTGRTSPAEMRTGLNLNAEHLLG